MTELMIQRDKLHDVAWYALDISIPKRSTRSDLDNLAKPIIDILHKMLKTPDDKFLWNLSMRWFYGDRVSLKITELTDNDIKMSDTIDMQD